MDRMRHEDSGLVRNPACAGCAYAGMAGHWPICAYILIEGQRRPCPPGPGCTVKRTEGVAEMPEHNNWDRERARALIAEGKKDPEIADMVGCSLPAFRSWKQREGLAKKRREQGSADETPATGMGAHADGDGTTRTGVAARHAGEPLAGRAGLEPAPPDQLAPVGHGIPVGLSLCLGGCAVTVEAPDLGCAIQLLELLRNLEKE